MLALRIARAAAQSYARGDAVELAEVDDDAHYGM
jgi:hypothetical protein